MALIRPSAIVAAISGSIGGQTFVNSKNGVVARPRPHKRPASSEKLLTQQSYFANVARRWRTITEQQRESWRALAANYPRSNRVGQASDWTGFTLYQIVTVNRLRAKGQYYDNPPNLRTITINPTVAVTFDDSSNYDCLFTLNATPSSTHGQIWGARHLSYIDPRRLPAWRLVNEFQFPGVAFYNRDVTDAWENTFGLMKLAERFSLRFVFYIPGSDLFPRAPVDFTGQVAAA